MPKQSVIREKTELEEQIDLQTQDLYTRALDGDMRAKTLWFDLANRKQSEELFNIQVNIVPYRISDPSLSNILQNADARVVADALKGLTLRMKSDGFDPKLLNAWENLQPEIFIWLEELEQVEDERN